MLVDIVVHGRPPRQRVVMVVYESGVSAVVSIRIEKPGCMQIGGRALQMHIVLYTFTVVDPNSSKIAQQRCTDLCEK